MTARSVPSLPTFGDRRRGRIGLLGGSFNPAHAGHVHLTREALRTLGLDQVWWLVSPQNPLKPTAGMARFSARLGGARETLRAAGLGRSVLATGIEGRLGFQRTAQTLRSLRMRYPNLSFVWLMGADNLAEISRWWRWTGIFRAARVAVFDRSPYSYKALASTAAVRFSSVRCGIRALWRHDVPAWSYVAMRRHPASATEIRRAAKPTQT